MSNEIKSVVDEFADLETVDAVESLVDTYSEHVSTALQLINNKTINGLDSGSIMQILSTNPTETMEFNHVSIKMNTKNLYYIGGTLVKDFRVFDFVSEIFPSDEDHPFSVLENIVIPNSVKVLHSEAFYNYHFLKNVIFEDNSGLEYLGSGAFAYCPKLLKLDLSACENLERIYAHTFACSGIKSVKLPNKLKIINERAFDDSDITNVTVGDTKYNISEFINLLKNNKYRNFWDFETMNSF